MPSRSSLPAPPADLATRSTKERRKAPLSQPTMSSFYSAEPLALLKLLLHAAKYPHASVNGLLLGRRAQGGGV